MQKRILFDFPKIEVGPYQQEGWSDDYQFLCQQFHLIGKDYKEDKAGQKGNQQFGHEGECVQFQPEANLDTEFVE